MMLAGGMEGYRYDAPKQGETLSSAFECAMTRFSRRRGHHKITQREAGSVRKTMLLVLHLDSDD